MAVAKETSSTENDPKQLSAQYVQFLRLLSTTWSSHTAAKLLTSPLIEYVRQRFHRCSTPLKVRILTALLYLTPQLVLASSSSLSQLIDNAERDRDDWVRKLSRLLRAYVLTGHLDVRDMDTETAYRTIKYLDDQRRTSGCVYRLKPPLEDSKVWNVLQDEVPQIPVSDVPTSPTNMKPTGDGTGANAASDVLTSPNTEVTGEGLQKRSLSTDGSRPPSSTSGILDLEALATLYQPEKKHFRCGGDFHLFMHEVQTAGYTVLKRELQQLTTQQNAKRLRHILRRPSFVFQLDTPEYSALKRA